MVHPHRAQAFMRGLHDLIRPEWLCMFNQVSFTLSPLVGCSLLSVVVSYKSSAISREHFKHRVAVPFFRWPRLDSGFGLLLLAQDELQLLISGSDQPLDLEVLPSLAKPTARAHLQRTCLRSARDIFFVSYLAQRVLPTGCCLGSLAV